MYARAYYFYIPLGLFEEEKYLRFFVHVPTERFVCVPYYYSLPMSCLTERELAKLSHELATATQVEADRYLIDETKKKAIVVSHSYEDFKNRVACAKMKPMSSDELRELGKSQAHERAFTFNTHSNNSDRSAVSLIANRAAKLRSGQTDAEAFGRAQAKQIVSKEVPVSGPALDRDWWRVGGDDAKFEFLRKVGSKRLKKIVKTSLPFDLVTDIFRVMDAFYEYQQVKLIGKIFIGFSKSSGIGMFQFALTEKDKAVILSLHNKLKTGISKMEEKAAAATKTGADGTPTEKKTTKKPSSLSLKELEVARGKFKV